MELEEILIPWGRPLVAGSGMLYTLAETHSRKPPLAATEAGANSH